MQLKAKQATAFVGHGMQVGGLLWTEGSADLALVGDHTEAVIHTAEPERFSCVLVTLIASEVLSLAELAHLSGKHSSLSTGL